MKIAKTKLPPTCLCYTIMAHTSILLLYTDADGKMVEDRFLFNRTEFMQKLTASSYEDAVYGWIHNVYGNMWIRTDKPALIGGYTFLSFIQSHKEGDRIYGNLSCCPNGGMDLEQEIIHMDFLSPRRDFMKEAFEQWEQTKMA